MERAPGAKRRKIVDVIAIEDEPPMLPITDEMLAADFPSLEDVGCKICMTEPCPFPIWRCPQSRMHFICDVCFTSMKQESCPFCRHDMPKKSRIRYAELERYIEAVYLNIHVCTFPGCGMKFATENALHQHSTLECGYVCPSAVLRMNDGKAECKGFTGTAVDHHIFKHGFPIPFHPQKDGSSLIQSTRLKQSKTLILSVSVPSAVSMDSNEETMLPPILWVFGIDRGGIYTFYAFSQSSIVRAGYNLRISINAGDDYTFPVGRIGILPFFPGSNAIAREATAHFPHYSENARQRTFCIQLSNMTIAAEFLKVPHFSIVFVAEAKQEAELVIE